MRLTFWCCADNLFCSDDNESSARPTGSKASKKSIESPDNLFDPYVDEDDADTMTVEGLGRLCEDAGISMDGAQPLLLSWQLDVSEFGTFKRDKWKPWLEQIRYVRRKT